MPMKIFALKTVQYGSYCLAILLLKSRFFFSFGRSLNSPQMNMFIGALRGLSIMFC